LRAAESDPAHDLKIGEPPGGSSVDAVSIACVDE
jgi:hypothetical protein